MDPRLTVALHQLNLARRYTLRLLDATSPDDWFRQPPGGVTHIAWQVGHLAVAEYRLTLERIRGRRPEDEMLLSTRFFELFRRESVPDADPTRYPTAAELRTVFDAVHQRARQVLETLPASALDRPPKAPHPAFDTKLGAIHWCALHEMVHTGQIGLLRRLLGYAPLW